MMGILKQYPAAHFVIEQKAESCRTTTVEAMHGAGRRNERSGACWGAGP
jgi:hypothetical protein